MAYLGETCPYCNGEGYIRRCPQCGNTKVKVIDVPGIWWEWRCECGWKLRVRYEPVNDTKEVCGVESQKRC